MLLSSIPQQQQQQQPRQYAPPYLFHNHTSHNHHSSQSETASSTLTSSPPSRYNKRALQQYRQEQLDSMSITVDEYAEVLNSEVWVEVNKLREYARHGIPREVRGVCIYLVLHSSQNRLFFVCPW